MVIFVQQEMLIDVVFVLNHKNIIIYDADKLRPPSIAILLFLKQTLELL